MKTKRLPLLAWLGAMLTLAPTAQAEEYCCKYSKGEDDPCNPEKWTCWPMERVARFGGCGRRDDTDCKYVMYDSVREDCCFTEEACYEAGESYDCYTLSADHDSRYCTEQYFFTESGAPATGFQGTVCGSDGFGGLDPHFQTWNGTWYDYMGVCDLVFLHAPDFDNGLGLDIHIRTKERGTAADPYKYTYVESAALRIGKGKDIFQVDSWGEYTLNGERNAKLPATLAGFQVKHVVVDEKRKKERFIVWLGKKERVVISAFRDLVSVAIKGATYESFGTSKGLMGAFGSGAKLARNNTPIADNDILFAEEWQVQDTDTKLFTESRPPQYPQKCIHEDSNVVKKALRRRLSQSTVSREAATAACARVKNKEGCISDVMQMDDLDLADEFPRD